MLARLSTHFIASSLALSLAGPIPAAQANPSAQKIGMIKLNEPLPFTPQDLIEPFGWRLRLTENKEKAEILVHTVIGTHIFTFYLDTDEKIRRIYSPLHKNDSDLCQSFDKLKEARPFIHQYLDKTFQAGQHCQNPVLYP